jgi:hypothetical protein
MVLTAALAVVVIGAPLGLTAPDAYPTQSAAATTAFSCGSDATSTLTDAMNAQSGRAVSLPPNRCFTVDGTISIHNVKNEVINGNSDTLVVPVQPSGTWSPVLMLVQDTNLTIENLRIVGGFNGSNGGAGQEGDYGAVFEADSGVTLTDDYMSNVQGDFLYLSPPYDANPASGALNTGISVTDSTFINAGYHGITVESVGCPTTAPCNGLTVSHDRFTNINVDAMDFEYDDYPTCLQNGVPIWAAENDVTIRRDIWINWGNDWFASVQGQNTPDPCNVTSQYPNGVPGGVSEQNLKLEDNTLIGDSALFEVVGTPQGDAPQQYWDSDWIINDNRFELGYYGKAYRGGDSVAAQLYFINDLTLSGNVFPLCDGQYEEPQPGPLCGPPNQYVFDWDWLTGNSDIDDNDFSGALGIQLPQPYGTGPAPVQCSNGWGTNDSSTDGSCTS